MVVPFRVRESSSPKSKMVSVPMWVAQALHDRLVPRALGGQAYHDPGEDLLVIPSLPTVVEGLGRALFLQCVARP